MSELRRFQKRNEVALLWQGILFFLGLCFIDGNAVVPVFVGAMGGSLALAGLVSAVRIVPSILAQFFVGVQSGRIGNLPRYITVMMASAYSLPIVIAAALLLNLGTAVSLAVFLVLYGLLWAGDGSLAIGWYELYGRVADPRRRGLIMGWQQLFGGLLALLGSYAVRLILGAEGLPVASRYAILFSLAGLIMAGSAIPMAFVRDNPHKAVKHENLLAHIALFPSLFRGNGLFRRMTAVQALQGVAAMSLPLLILFSRSRLGFSLAGTAWLVTAQTAGSLTGGLVWGVVSHRLGNRRIILINQCNIFLIMTLALVAALTGAFWLAFPLSLFSGITFSSWMGYPNYIIDITDEGRRSQYLVMSSLVSLPTTFMPWIAGLLAEKFGFVPLFALCMAVAAVSFFLSTGLQRSAPDSAEAERPADPVNI